MALHAASAAALAPTLRHELRGPGGGRRLLELGLTLGPPAVAGLLLERVVERRLGSARAVAALQLAGGTALALADRAPTSRRAEQAGPLDLALVGAAQALAILPGVSRAGAILTAARARRFERAAAARLARRAGLPVILAAAILKGLRALHGETLPDLRAAVAAGSAAAFVSGLAGRRLASALERAPSYTPLAAYRMGLGTVVLVRLRATNRRPHAGVSARAVLQWVGVGIR